MDIYQILYLIIALASFFLTTLIPTAIVLIKKMKALKEAKDEAEKQKALNELIGAATAFIQDAENTYKDIDSALKAQQKGSCGAAKKEVVMSKLRMSALELKVPFDQEFWDKKIDELVDMTRKVNAKK